MKCNRKHSFIDSCLRPPAVRDRPENHEFCNYPARRAGIVRAIPDWGAFTGTVPVVAWPKRQSVKQNGEYLVSDLTIELLRQEATAFSRIESSYPEPSLYGVSDGKAIGTYLEHKFRAYLTAKGYAYVMDSIFLGWTLTSKSPASGNRSPRAHFGRSSKRSMVWATRCSSSFTTKLTILKREWPSCAW